MSDVSDATDFLLRSHLYLHWPCPAPTTHTNSIDTVWLISPGSDQSAALTPTQFAASPDLCARLGG